MSSACKIRCPIRVLYYVLLSLLLFDKPLTVSSVRLVVILFELVGRFEFGARFEQDWLMRCLGLISLHPNTHQSHWFGQNPCWKVTDIWSICKNNVNIVHAWIERADTIIIGWWVANGADICSPVHCDRLLVWRLTCDPDSDFRSKTWKLHSLK